MLMKSTYLYVALVVALIIGLIVIRNYSNKTTEIVSTPFDTFAQCLTDAGAKFFGAYWCPHCQSQKKLLQNSKKLPYIECSTPDGKSQTQICIDANITSYPTWDFADGTRLDSELSLEELSTKTSCPLPIL